MREEENGGGGVGGAGWRVEEIGREKGEEDGS